MQRKAKRLKLTKRTKTNKLQNEVF